MVYLIGFIVYGLGIVTGVLLILHVLWNGGDEE